MTARARLLRILRRHAAEKRRAGPTKWQRERRAEIRAARFAGMDEHGRPIPPRS